MPAGHGHGAMLMVKGGIAHFCKLFLVVLKDNQNLCSVA